MGLSNVVMAPFPSLNMTLIFYPGDARISEVTPSDYA